MSTKYKILTLIVFVIIVYSFETKASNLDEGIAKVCGDYEKVSEIMLPYVEQAWPGVSLTPSGPVPTVTFFTLAPRQPILDFCRFIIQLKNLRDGEAVFSTLDYANNLSGRQHTEKIDFMRETYDLGTALNAFSQGNRDVSQSQSLHRRINSYLRTQDKFFNGDNANTFESRAERERKMANIVRMANNIAIIKESNRCPEPKIDDEEKNLKYYNDEIVPLYQLIEEREDEVAFYLGQLQRMGVNISRDYNDNSKYQKKLLDVYSLGVTFSRSAPQTKLTKSYSPVDPVKKVKRTYYTYSILQKAGLFSDFINDYNGAWISYTARFIKLWGLANGPLTEVEKTFRDSVSYECRRNKIQWTLRRTNPSLQYEEAGSARFTLEVDRKVEECKAGKKINEKQVNGLLAHYVNELKIHLSTLKNLQTKVWNYDSEYLGNSRTVAVSLQASDIGDVTREEVSCEKTLNASESNLVKTKLQGEELELRAMAAEEMMKKTMTQEAEFNKKNKELDDKRRDFYIKQEAKKREDNISEELAKPSMDGLGF